MKQFQQKDKSNASASFSTFSSVFLRFALGSLYCRRLRIGSDYGAPSASPTWHGEPSPDLWPIRELNWFLPKATIPALAIVSTFAETILAILLLFGWQTRIAAVLSGALLLSFAVTMTGALGIKAPLDLSVFSAAGGAFLLASSTEYPFSVDQLRKNPS